ncbi:RpiB/LacA/LacB family sugar-phosphate isomerase [Parapedobacter sp. ISTM3]|uniref:Ribose 5-phosphate isomerase B n=1 Tax=Parapedobacter luteus TaxID=623280 RepID=A0A1T5A008_9SPHI|nr:MULTISPECIES: RpiB/LacA/LacB family sugar-phosphate isomerase [Parapedobacter]MBK1438831.1 RpiB/LacA/LacB family sugar-phosphate isomerase [Parapedobacter sp. ISTM3]SKB28089.1 ribose 5-phosphate isomerase B [Parapedobacter luteus]
MKVGIAADHAGFEQKKLLMSELMGAGYQVQDYGALAYDPADDYPDIIIPLARAVANKEVERGIAVCGSGVGVSIAANKIPGVRAALITDTYSAHQGVEHDDMNLLCVGGRVIGPMLIWELANAFLQAEYDGGERFERRLQKVLALEKHALMGTKQ